VYAARDVGPDSPRILGRASGVVALDKPAALASVADHRGRAGSLEQSARELAGSDALVATSRLDVGVSGVVLFATDEDARKRLARAREEGRYRRHYVAIATRAPDPASGIWSAPIGRDRDPRLRRAFGKDAVHAETAYRVVAVAPRAALVAVEPRTGRTHQIRVHAAHAGAALWGDVAYGGPGRLVSEAGAVTAVSRIALHAAWVEVPAEGSPAFRADAPLPDDFVAIWISCGGDPSALAMALDPLDPAQTVLKNRR
jgi:23S rRNA-/tRNA-specific pseudouridylate synthase